jgi:Cyclin
MPSYSQPQYSRYQGYLTPPDELLRNYAKENMIPHQYQQNPFPVPIRIRQENERGHDYHDPYSLHSQQRLGPATRVSPQSLMYPGAPYLSSIGTVSNHHANGYYKPSVILPPMRTFPPVSAPVVDPQPQVSRPTQPPPQHDRSHQEHKEERPVGGVSAKLDYDMDTMTDFVAKTAHGMYELLTSPSISITDIDMAGSIMPNRQAPSSFRKWVHQVLSATRLPSSTILLAFDYLSIHMRYAQATRMVDFGESELYHMLTTALILGSKFLDDNTFINRSWAEVSGIDVGTLNRLEHQWLREMDFRLHREPSTPRGFQTFQNSWKQFEAERRVAHDSSRQMNGSSSQVSSQQVQSSYPPTAQPFDRISPPPTYPAESQQNYPTPGFARYDAFAPVHPSTNTSPPSAPHTGPTTPEYYGPHSTWPSIGEAYGLARLPPPAYSQAPSGPASLALSQAPSGPFVSMSYQPSPIYASSHGSECFCNACNRQYMMVPHFGMPLPVIG